MSKFKELKRSTIEIGREPGNDGLVGGEQRYGELREVKSLIDSLSLEDDADMRQIAELNAQYRQEGIEAYQNEVESAVEHGREILENNKSSIAAERRNVEESIEKVGDMKGRTDLARNEAGNVERNLGQSAAEYKNMEATTDQIENEQERQSQDILRRIENLFG